MTNKHRYATVSSGLVAILLVGCGSVDGAPVPDSDSGPAGHSSAVTSSDRKDEHPRLPYAGAPKVSEPVDVSDYAKKPCSVVTERQLQALGLSKGRVLNAAVPACSWSPSGGSNESDAASEEIQAGFELTGKGLSQFFAKRKVGEVKLSELNGTVNGFPVVQFSYKNERNPPDCSIAVGISDEQVIGVKLYDRSTGSAPCSDAQSVTKAVTATIRQEG